MLPLSFPDTRSVRICAILPLASFLCLFLGSAFPQTKPSSTSFAALSKRADEARDADRLKEAVALYTRALALQPKWKAANYRFSTLVEAIVTSPQFLNKRNPEPAGQTVAMKER